VDMRVLPRLNRVREVDLPQAIIPEWYWAPKLLQ
jgi:hypothetical protein